jgi:penicillin amidase
VVSGLLLLALLGVGLQLGRERSAQREAFPILEGRLGVEGVEAPLEVERGPGGVPHVKARSTRDAIFGLGFVHAQDRLGQMQWLVRLARGRTAEVVGAAGLPADRMARTLDLGGVADAEIEGLEPATRELLEAYASGVNARIGRIRAGEVALPVSMRQAGVPLEDWRPADSLAVLKLYAWILSASVDASLVLDDLLGRLGGVGARRFFPGGPGGELRPAPGLPPVTAGRWRDPLRKAAGLEGASVGSSAWVVGGAHTASGRPLLAADSHLEPTAPPWLHIAQLSGGELEVAGAALPGVPGFWTGHNRQVAWASTHARAAVTDLYVEILHPKGEPRYHNGRGWRALRERVETIAVRGAQDEVLTVRSTRHGPLLDGLLSTPRDPIAVGWVGLRRGGGGTLEALLAVARAPDADAFLRGLSRLHEPALAVVYADAEGAAGMQVAGWVPRRALATELVPVPGRARWYDWQGRLPFDRLPRVRLEGGRGWAIAADNRLPDPDGADQSEWLWRNGIRAQRIDARLRESTSRGRVDLDALLAIQLDVEEGRGRTLVAAALGLVDEASMGREAREVAGLLRAWDGDASEHSIGAAVYHVFLAGLSDQIFRHWLGEELAERYLAVPQADPGQVVHEILREAAAGGEKGTGWERDRLTAQVARSLRETWFRLSAQLGASRGKWRWGRLHRLAFHPFGSRGRASRPALGPFEAGGSGTTVNAAEFAATDSFGVRVASTMRFAVDAARLDRGLWALAPGQSEHPGHPHYADGLPRWRAGRPAEVPIGDGAPEEAPRPRLVLEPVP